MADEPKIGVQRDVARVLSLALESAEFADDAEAAEDALSAVQEYLRLLEAVAGAATKGDAREQARALAELAAFEADREAPTETPKE